MLVVSYLLPDRKSNLYNFTMHDIALCGSQSYQIFYCYFNGQSDAFIVAVSAIQVSSRENYKLMDSVNTNNCLRWVLFTLNIQNCLMQLKQDRNFVL